ncbi:MAG TPA: ATP-binding cassette domain-containing protein [Clostridiales bacterium]|nr:MAG: putative HMP/thiamine import ATP-binding protein YkoD [Firmicutes bacterium ADurb.Bin262]HOU10361.1 ATP-binding cassette domain-containing protein [Clostridiales bacterium]HQH62510.1 ATP-binding cassette domain-containing protein [Clostridiales bacterium]HQK73094.1 ATP-binding cassette domain-containing protein [Clostridiales bacterium]
MAFVSVRNLNFAYADGSPALSDVNLTAEKGEFVLICGPSGCGKTSLLKMMKPGLQPRGKTSGSIEFDGRPLNEYGPREAAQSIGIILQNPDSQTVCDSVRSELAFGLESIETPLTVMSKRISETVSYFGIEKLYLKKTAELSGGEKQLVILAAIIAMRPSLLLLDEPSSQLDPVAARQFYDILTRTNRELGITVLVSEHRITDIYAFADKVALMDKGRIVFKDTPGKAAAWAVSGNSESLEALLPVPSALSSYLIQRAVRSSQPPQTSTLPFTVKDAKTLFEGFARERLGVSTDNSDMRGDSYREERQKAVELKNVSYRFSKYDRAVLDSLWLDINYGEILAIVGGNGVGKTTLLRLTAGLIKPSVGRIGITRPSARIAYLPQNPQCMFSYDTVGENLLAAAGEKIGSTALSSGLDICGRVLNNEDAARAAETMTLDGLLEKHPYDISFGEMQRAAIAMLLIRQPDILLMDEPSRGLDHQAKTALSAILRCFRNEKKAVVFVTHDIEFAAEYADSCAMLFDGKIYFRAEPHDFFSGNMCYTTAAHRIAGSVFPNAVTLKDVMELWEKNEKKS